MFYETVTLIGIIFRREGLQSDLPIIIVKARTVMVVNDLDVIAIKKAVTRVLLNRLLCELLFKRISDFRRTLSSFFYDNGI